MNPNLIKFLTGGTLTRQNTVLQNKKWTLIENDVYVILQKSVLVFSKLWWEIKTCRSLKAIDCAYARTNSQIQKVTL